MSIGSWDELRSNQRGNEAFVMPDDRDAWLTLCANPATKHAAADVARVIVANRIRRIVSVGVGRGCLEYHLSVLLPDVELVCAEYSNITVERLRRVFLECKSIQHFDLRSTKWPWGGDQQTVVLLYRVDTELNDAALTQLMAGMSSSGIQNILIVATGFAGAYSVLKAFVYAIAFAFRVPGVTLAGYLRSEERFVDILCQRHVIKAKMRVGDLTGFFLTPR